MKMSRPFKGLFLQKTGAPFVYSFVTYTPQTKEQMIACGDLAEGEEFLSQVVCDFLLFVSEGILCRALTVALKKLLPRARPMRKQFASVMVGTE